jgi:hypothetical protein
MLMVYAGYRFIVYGVHIHRVWCTNTALLSNALLHHHVVIHLHGFKLLPQQRDNVATTLIHLSEITVTLNNPTTTGWYSLLSI